MTSNTRLLHLRCALQHLGGEVVEQGVGQGPIEVVRRQGCLRRLFQQQDRARRPAARALMQIRDRLGRQAREPVAARQRARLRHGERELTGVEGRQPPRGPPAGEGRRRVIAAEHEHTGRLRQRVEPLRQQRVQRSAIGQLVIVVEDQQAGRGQQRPELLEEVARVGGDPECVFRGEQRQEPARPRGDLGGRFAQVIEEGGRIGVARVELEPEQLERARVGIPGRQGRLPRARPAP